MNNTNSGIRFKTTMLKSSLCDYSHAYILVKEQELMLQQDKQMEKYLKGVIFKNCAPFVNCKSEINNTEIDYAKYIDIVIPMYNLIEYSDNYSKTSGSLL